MSEMGGYHIHRMIQDLLRDSAAAAQFAVDPSDAFARYGVTAEEASLLETLSIEGMAALQVHPNLQMKYLRLRAQPGAVGKLKRGPLDAYLSRLLEG
jgi:hypothetical protein